MKKYNRPELTVSSFAVEDIIMASGEVATVNALVEQFGITFQSTVPGGGTPEDGNATYFSWNAE